MAKKADANYERPRSQVDLEERLAKGNESDLVLSTYSDEKPEPDENARVFTLEDNEVENYIGVDPVYQNYADETTKPMRAEDGPEAELEARAYGEADEAFEVPEGWHEQQVAPPQRVVIAGIEDGVNDPADDAAKGDDDAAKGSDDAAKGSDDAAKGSDDAAKGSDDAAKGDEGTKGDGAKSPVTPTAPADPGSDKK